MQLLHEAVDMTQFWEKSPPSKPQLCITIPFQTFPITCQRWSVLVSVNNCVGAEARGSLSNCGRLITHW